MNTKKLTLALGALCLAFSIASYGASSDNSEDPTSGPTPIGKKLKPASNGGVSKKQIPIKIEVDVGKAGRVVSPLLFGTNLEHTRNAIWRGLGAQVIANCKFAGPAHSDGLVAGWSPVGAPAAHFQIDREKPYAGEQSQRVSVAAKGVVAGIAQDHVPLLKNCAYQARLALRSEKALKVSVRVCDQQGENCYKVQTLSVKPGEWRELEFSFTPSRTDREARIEITFDGPATLCVGSVSILPKDHFHGMRRDVVELLKTLGSPLLRWPGGNFMRDYKWRDGLLPVDRRPPTKCTWRSTLPYSYSYDFHEIGTDEFIALCRYIGAEPCITINLDPQTAPPSEAAAWVEYCNGGSGTRMGKVRAARGHREPYGVKYWFVGNEIWGHWMGRSHSDATTYAERLIAYTAAMKEVDPSIQFVASGQGVMAPEEGAKWDNTLLSKAAAHFDVLSQHHYAPAVSWFAGPQADAAYDQKVRAVVEGLPVPGPEAEREFAELSHFAVSTMLPLLRNVRQAIDQRDSGRHIGIALDEWNVWRNWFTKPYENAWHDSVTEAVYAAGMLNMFC
ncbi:MAG TPA: carbohydrate binding domain-containing protein, partial [Candidatus Eisenbacteria bacterium]|nr:carbohydrate binding domain-containing protein [Candidatus Eisenbacteria bacterium]